MSQKGVLTVISGFSGAGKGTIVKQLCSKYAYALSISATTRGKREGEQEGVHYFYKTVEEFQALIENEGLIEWTQYVGNYYGTPKAYVEEKLASGENVILEIETEGALNVKKIFPDAVLIFVTPPSAKILEERLTGRGTETADVIANRMHRAKEECQFISDYDYVVINDELDACVEQVHGIITACQSRKEMKEDIINLITKELDIY